MSKWLNVIGLPTDEARVAQLRRKLVEYDQRMLATKSVYEKFGTVCKAALLREILANGHVVVAEVEQKLREQYGDDFEADLFGNAHAVIRDYCLTGGENCSRGGLS